MAYHERLSCRYLCLVRPTNNFISTSEILRIMYHKKNCFKVHFIYQRENKVLPWIYFFIFFFFILLQVSCLFYWGVKNFSGAPREARQRSTMGKKMKWSTHPRKFGNHVTVHRLTARPPERPSVRTTGIPMFTLTHSRFFGSPQIAHQCCDQLTAVKTRHPLSSITWPYRGLRCRPIQVEYFFCSYPLASY